MTSRSVGSTAGATGNNAGVAALSVKREDGRHRLQKLGHGGGRIGPPHSWLAGQSWRRIARAMKVLPSSRVGYTREQRGFPRGPAPRGSGSAGGPRLPGYSPAHNSRATPGGTPAMAKEVAQRCEDGS